jgi:hypothetical protein
MFPLDYIMAAALLAAPPEGVDSTPAFDAHFAFCPAVQQLAVDWEILDPREVRFLLVNKEDYHSDMAMMRQRYHDLLDAPPLHDCMRFPPRAAVSEMLAFNRAYREQLEKRRELEHSRATEYQEILQEAERLFRLWEAIRDTRCEYYYVNVRRQALKRVRDTIGEQAFYNGNFPPHVPVWRFQRID